MLPFSIVAVPLRGTGLGRESVASCFFTLRRDRSWSYQRSAGRHRQYGGPLHVDRVMAAPVVDGAAGGTRPLPDIERLGPVLDAAGGAGLGRRLEPADRH